MTNNHFTIVMTGKNSKPYIEKSITSALNQDYDDFEIILFDAESDDGSYDIACEFESKNSHRLSVIRNNPRQFQGANILEGAKLAIPNSILINLDTDDWLENKKVLNKLNEIYQDDIWMTYGGSYIESTGRDVRNIYEPYPQEVINNNEFRSHRWLASHLRSFKKELFLQINEEDLKDSETGEFYSYAPDLSFMWPMLEMSGNRAKYTNEIFYVYNTENEFNEAKINQSEINRIESQVRSKPSYNRLETV